MFESTSEFWYQKTNELPEDVGDYYVWSQLDTEDMPETTGVFRIYELEIKSVAQASILSLMFNQQFLVGEKVKMCCLLWEAIPLEAQRPELFDKFKQIYEGDLVSLEGKVDGLTVDQLRGSMWYARIPTLKFPTIN